MTGGAGDIRVGLMGKHPAFGDFLSARVLYEVETALTAWIDRSLTALRAELQKDWAEFWRHGQVLRFWIGREVFGQSVLGIYRPWHDKVGREYPLLLVVQGARVVFPGYGGAVDQTPWEALENHLANTRAATGGGAALLEGLEIDLPPETDAERLQGKTIWAHQTDGDLTALLRQAAQADPARAALGRSYWWSPGDSYRTAVWLGCDGLPDPRALGWLLAGTRKTGGAVGE